MCIALSEWKRFTCLVKECFSASRFSFVCTRFRAFAPQAHPPSWPACQSYGGGGQRRGVRVQSLQWPATTHPVAQTHRSQREQSWRRRSALRQSLKGKRRTRKQFSIRRSVCFYKGLLWCLWMYSKAISWRYLTNDSYHSVFFYFSFFCVYLFLNQNVLFYVNFIITIRYQLWTY